jgi:RHS repeat-associated protein
MLFSSFARTRQRLGAALLSLLLISTAHAATDEIVYFHTDANGSPTAAFNEAGEVCWTETYSPYGEKLDNEDSLPPAEGCGLLAPNDVGYTGHVQDNGSGLVYAQQRYYDPQIGRFMSTDPVMPNAGEPRHFGRYHYAFNNPYRYTDPHGMEPGPEDGDEYDEFVDANYGAGVGYGYEGSHNGLDTNGAMEEFVGLQDVIGESEQRSVYNDFKRAAIFALGRIRVGRVPKKPTIGGGATLDKLSPAEIQRIQNAATRSNTPITVVGSRVNPQKSLTPKSDYDYAISANSKTRNNLSRSLPGSKSVQDGVPSNQDIFTGPVDINRPHVTFHP